VTMWKALLLRGAVPVVSRFPAPCYNVAWIAGWLASMFLKEARRRVVRNLAPACEGNRVRGRELSVEVFRNVARYYVDLASLPGRNMATLESQYLLIEGERHLAPLREPGPVMIVSAHLGNPEFAVQALAQRGRPFSAVVEPLQPRAFAEAMLKLRSAGGGRYHEATVTGVAAAIRDLRDGAVLCLLGDRDIQETGVCVDFLGRKAMMPRGPWEIARRETATVIPMFAERLDGVRCRVYVEEPMLVARSEDANSDICEAASAWAKLLEGHIRQRPGQWTVLEDFWAAHGCRPESGEDRGQPK
jgi:phosphatidylinositol dimannoside acyltransferase